jgi:hypothetical protein
MLSVLQIEGYIFGSLRDQENNFVKSVGIPDFIKNIWIFRSHIGDDDVCLVNLIEDPIEHPLDENLLVHAFCISVRVLGRAFDAKFVDIAEPFIERHQYENEGFRFRAKIPVWHGSFHCPVVRCARFGMLAARLPDILLDPAEALGIR